MQIYLEVPTWPERHERAQTGRKDVDPNFPFELYRKPPPPPVAAPKVMRTYAARETKTAPEPPVGGSFNFKDLGKRVPDELRKHYDGVPLDDEPLWPMVVYILAYMESIMEKIPAEVHAAFVRPIPGCPSWTDYSNRIRELLRSNPRHEVAWAIYTSLEVDGFEMPYVTKRRLPECHPTQSRAPAKSKQHLQAMLTEAVDEHLAGRELSSDSPSMRSMQRVLDHVQYSQPTPELLRQLRADQTVNAASARSTWAKLSIEDLRACNALNYKAMMTWLEHDCTETDQIIERCVELVAHRFRNVLKAEDRNALELFAQQEWATDGGLRLAVQFLDHLESEFTCDLVLAVDEDGAVPERLKDHEETLGRILSRRARFEQDLRRIGVRADEDSDDDAR